MSRIFVEEMKFENQNYRGLALETGDYENCIFANCDFSDAILSDITFIDCEFSGCNLSLTQLIQTSFRDTRFIQCKMIGLHFKDCSPFMISLRFRDCIMELCSFDGLMLKNCPFKNCRVIEADFTEADLTNASFLSCDLDRTIFRNTILESADFSTSFNYIIDPDANKLKKTRFSSAGLPGLLGKYDIEIV
jgi:uncharacterized protein YjbI with pentapeptide repeats